MERVKFEDEMLAKLDECDKWLNGKDEAFAEVERCENALAEAKHNAEEYTDDNIAEVEAYRKDLEGKLISLGILERKEEVIDEPIAEVKLEDAPIEETIIEEAPIQFAEELKD